MKELEKLVEELMKELSSGDSRIAQLAQRLLTIAIAIPINTSANGPDVIQPPATPPADTTTPAP